MNRDTSLTTESSTDGGNVPAVFESLESRLLLDAAPTFEADLADLFTLAGDGYGLTIGVDGADADGDALTISVDTGGVAGLTFAIRDQQTTNNRYALVHITDHNGDPMGDILVQLFEDAAPLATERFIILAENHVASDGTVSAPTVENPAFYTDVDIHRVIDEFMLQTGDAVNADGTGGSPLPDYVNEVDANLGLNGPGVLANANRGADTNNSQWFISDESTPWLNGDYTIFGHMISGQDVYDAIMTLETDGNDRPLDTPVVSSIEILAGSDQDGAISFFADETFTEAADVTVTLTDGDGNTVSQTITVTPDPSISLDPDTFAVAPGQVVDLPLTVENPSGEPLTFDVNPYYDGPGDLVASIEPGVGAGEYDFHLEIPAEYDGQSFYIEFMAAYESSANPLPSFFNALGYGYSTDAIWYDYFRVDRSPKIDAVADVTVVPGEQLTVTLPISYAGDGTLTTAVSHTYANGGAWTDNDVQFDGDVHTLTLDIPAEWNGDAFTVTVDVGLEGRPDIPAESQTFNVVFDERPGIVNPEAITATPGDTVNTILEILDPEGDAGGIELAISTTQGGATATIDEATGEASITCPADFVGVFEVVVTALETKYAGADPENPFDGALVEPAQITLYVSTLGDQASIDPISDASFAPLEATEVTFSIDFNADASHSPAFVLSHDYEGPGEIGLAVVGDDPAAPYTLAVALPAEYDQRSFNITVGLTVDGYENVVTADETTFQFNYTQRPRIEDPGLVEVVPGGTTTVPLTITDADTAVGDLTVSAEADHDDAVVSIDAANVLTVTAPAGFEGVFSVTVTAVETAYDGEATVTPTTQTITVSTLAPTPAIDPIDDIDDAAPGATVSVDVPVTFDGAQNVILTATSDYDGTLDLSGAVTPGDPAVLSFVLPADYDGTPFTVTVTATVEGYEDLYEPEVATFDVSFGVRPQITDPGMVVVDGGVEDTITLTVTDDVAAQFDLTVTADHDDVIVDVDSDTGVISLTTPAEPILFNLTVTAVERDLAALHANLRPSTITFEVLNVGEAPAIDPLADVDLAPGDTIDIVIPATGAGEHLTLTATSEYGNGGDFTLPNPVLEHDDDLDSDQWVLHLTLPAEYDGRAFAITVTAGVEGVTLTDPPTQTFEVAFGVRPEIDAPESVSIGAGNALVVPVVVTDPDGSDNTFAVTATADNPGVTIEVIDPTEVAPNTYELHITVDDDVRGDFTVTVTAMENNLAGYANLDPTAETFTVDVATMLAISDIDLSPGADTYVNVPIVYGGDDDVTVTATNDFTGTGTVSTTILAPATPNGPHQLHIQVSNDYDGGSFTVTIEADVDGEAMAPTALEVSTGQRPSFVEPAPVYVTGGDATSVDLTITGRDDNVTVTVSDKLPDGLTVTYNEATGAFDITAAADFDAGDGVTVPFTIVETGWVGFDSTAPATGSLTIRSQVGFETELNDTYILPADGHGLTIPIDAWAPDGQAISIDAVYTNRHLKKVVAAGPYVVHANKSTTGTRFAELVFTESDGVTEIGTMVVQLFDTRSAAAATRFVTLATNEVIPGAWDFAKDTPTATLNPDGAPFYTDVPVHWVNPGAFFMTGDATEGDGTGVTYLGGLEDDFGPDPYWPGNLSFAGPGVLAYDNTGEGTSDGQFFITEKPTPDSNGGYMIFGQVISGWDVYTEMIYRPHDQNGRPDDPPLLAGVNIIEDNVQDGSITLTGTKYFIGKTDVTITLTAIDAEGVANTATKTVTVVADSDAYAGPTLGEVIEVPIAAGETATIPLTINYNAADGSTERLTAVSAYDGDGKLTVELIDLGESEYELQITPPADYNGETFTVTVEALVANADGVISNRSPISTAVYTVYDTGDISIFTEHGDGAPQFQLQPSTTTSLTPSPGGTVEYKFAVEYDDDDDSAAPDISGIPDISVIDNYTGPGSLSTEVVDLGDGLYAIRAAVGADYDGSDFILTVQIERQGVANSSPLGFLIDVGLGERPTISDPGLITLDPGANDTVALTITDADNDEFTFEVETDHPGAAASVNTIIDPETDAVSYELDVSAPAGFTGVVAVTVKVWETDYYNAYPDGAGSTVLAGGERIVYVSTLGDRPVIDADGATQTVRATAGETIPLNVPVTDDSGVALTYAISTDTLAVLAELNDGVNGFGDADGGAFTLTLPTDFFGMFNVTVTAVESDPHAAEALDPTSYTITVIVSPDGDDAPPVGSDDPDTNIHLDLEGDVTATLSYENWLFVGNAEAGVDIYDMSDPTNPIRTDEFGVSTDDPNDAVVDNPAEEFFGVVRTMEVVEQVVDGQTRMYLLVAAAYGGLYSIELDAAGTIQGWTRESIYANDVDVDGDTAYVAAGGEGLISYDISNAADPTELDQFDSFGPSWADRQKYQDFTQHKALWTYYFSNAVAVEVRGDHVLVAEQIGSAVVSGQGGLVSNPGSKGWVGIVNAANPANLQKLGMIRTNAYVQDIDVQGRYLYVLNHTKLGVYQFSGGSTAVGVGAVDLDTQPVSLTVINTTAVVTSDVGFEFIDLTNLRSMTVTDTYRVLLDTWGDQLITMPVDTGGSTMYLPVNDSGVVTFDADNLKPQVDSITRAKQFWLDATPVTVRISGGGTVDVIFDDLDPIIDHITVTGATANTVVSIVTPRGTPVEVGEITIDGPVRNFYAPTLTLTGDFTADGSVGALTLGDVGTDTRRVEQTLTLGAPVGDRDPQRTTIVLGSVFDARLNCATPIHTLSAVRWMDSESELADAITAPSIQRLLVRGYGRTIAGDFQADLALDAAGDPAWTMNLAYVAGAIDESDWNISGDVNQIRVNGSVMDSQWDITGDVNVIRTIGDVDSSGWNIDGRANILLVGGDVDSSTWDIGGDLTKAIVHRYVRDSWLSAEGNIRVAVFGALIDSSIFAGYLAEPNDIVGLPTAANLQDAATFTADGTITYLAVNGIKLGRTTWDGVANSHIAAGTLGTVKLTFAQLDNGDDPFGLATGALSRFYYRDLANRPKLWRNDFPSEADDPRMLDDLIVRIV